MPISAIDAVSPAFAHAKQQLLQPFRGGQWAKLALVGFFAGELGSGGCSTSGFRMPSNGPLHPFPGLRLPSFDPLTTALVVTAFFVAVVVFWVLFLYLNSIMRFVLFDSIVSKQCQIREYWRRRRSSGLRYFFWQVLFLSIIVSATLLLVAISLALAYVAGWLKQPKEHLLPLLLIFAPLVMVLMGVAIFSALVMLFSKDFIVPQMALEELNAFQAWRRMLVMIKTESASYAAYVGMKIVLALGAGLVLGIVSAIALVFILLPTGIIGMAAVLLAHSIGLGWNIYTISLAVVCASAIGLFLLYVLSLVSVPAIVFFPAYSLHFFASRYAPLASALYPAPPPLLSPPFSSPAPSLGPTLE